MLFLSQIFPINSRVGVPQHRTNTGDLCQREGLGWSWGHSTVDFSRLGSIPAQ